MMGALNDGDRIELHVAEVANRGESSCLPAAKGRLSSLIGRREALRTKRRLPRFIEGKLEHD